MSEPRDAVLQEFDAQGIAIWRDSEPSVAAMADEIVTLRDALALATQRAEAAERERDEVMRCCRGTRMDDAALVSIRDYVAEKLRIEAERDALRKVDDAMVERAANAMAFVHGGRPIGTYADGTQAAMRKEARAALDAALAVQPTTEAST